MAMSTGASPVDYRALLKRAHDRLEEMQDRLAGAERARHEPIAIIGMGVRFPGGGDDPASFWTLLHDGVDVVTEVPRERWDADAFFDPDPDAAGKSYTRWGAFLERIDAFDPQFFGISPREAAAMDPQHRLLLEVAWEALENAGRAGAGLAGSRTGVFVGMAGSDFAVLPRGDLELADTYFATGAARSIAAGRISYTLGLQGPSLAVDTACSSSAVATHLACQSLRTRDSDVALAGGVNVMLAPDGSITTSRGRMMSFTGRCRTFDAGADGYVRAEGCAMLVLKRLADAVADGDNIQAVILGTAVNQDGRSNGLTAPNAQAQEAVMRAALADAGLEPGEIGLIEAHGTGTSLGDPIEMRALSAVFAAGRAAGDPLMVGSVKTNIGHTEGVAGTAGLVKLVLALQHRTVPPHLHLTEPNPLIPWDELPVTVPTTPTAWRVAAGLRRIGGVSSFGFSGTNSHIIVAEPPATVAAPAEEPRCRLLTLSARTEPALGELADRWARHLTNHPAIRLADAAWTASTGRAHLAERLAVVAATPAQARERLAAWRAGEPTQGVVRGGAGSGVAPQVAFLFTGQGAQYIGMGRGLRETERVFHDALRRCDELLRPHLERPLLGLLYPRPGDEEEAERLLQRTAYTQPALFAVEYALARLWLSWGIEPTLMMGHSVGEYVAACVAGVFDLEDGLRLIAMRGRLMDALPGGGAMAAVFADEAMVAAAVADHADAVSIAAINGPRNVVISGRGDAVREILAGLAARGVQARALRVSHAFHSPLVEPMLEEFEQLAGSVAFAEPEIGLVSNLTGALAGAEIATANYWRRHVRAAVRFADGMRTLSEQGCTAMLEIGPSPTLLGMAQQCLPDAEALWLPSLRRDRDDAEQLLESLATLHVHGGTVDWTAVGDRDAHARLPLPTYPFQRRRYWIEFPEPGRPAGGPRHHPLVHERIRSPLIAGQAFQSRLGVRAPAFLDDHRIYDVPLFPAAAFVEMAAAAGRLALGDPQAVEELRIRDALTLPESGESTVQIAIGPAEAGLAGVRIFSLGDAAADRWTLHAEGQLRAGEHAPAAAVSLDGLRARVPAGFDADRFYRRLEQLGVRYGPAFRALREIWRHDGEAFARVELRSELGGDAAAYGLHPALLDACVQLLGAAVPGADAEGSAARVYVPVEIGGYRVHAAGARSGWCHAALTGSADASAGDLLSGELRLYDDLGSPIASVERIRLRRAPRETIERLRREARPDPRLDWLYQLDWEPADAPQQESGWATGRWLVLADAGGVGDALAERIGAAGGSCTLLRAESADPLDTAAFEPLLAPGGEGGPMRGIIQLWSLDAPTEPAATDAAILEQQRRACGSTVALLRAAAAAGLQDAGFWLVTRGAQPVGEADPVEPGQAPLWGLAESITLEHPELRCVCIDLDATPAAAAADALATELAATDAEDRVAWRAGARWAARLDRYAGGSHDRAGQRTDALELVATGSGVLDDLELRAAQRRAPRAGELEIEVRASGLNFRDVLNALGMYPGDAGPLGSECAGVVTAVGEAVEPFRAGDRVIALASGTFRSHVVASATSVFPKPEPLDWQQAAGIPLALLTAYHGLHELAGIRPGDRVLIHAAAGGVGVAAVQLALRAGAEVFGTAGSERKREFLRSLGVRHVMDSRSLRFAEQTRELTGGAGVDIVLNALADDFIPASLGVLADGGCFLEIGKRGIWSREQVAELNPTLRYHAYDLADVIRDDPAWFRATLGRLMPAFESGELAPLPPTVFPLARAAAAFRFMAQAKHIGKVVLSREHQGGGTTIRGDATYLVTGGLGGIGLLVARWLADRGARSIVLVGRHEPGEAARAAIAGIEATGARVAVHRADVGDEEEVGRLLSHIAGALPSLRGVVHAAGLLDDGMLLQQDWPRFEAVMHPKVRGGWHLHRATRGMELDFFWLFSAGAALLGSAGQGSYAAANAFLDALAARRRRLGLPATSFGWGAWAEVGMAARVDARDRDRWRDHGIGMIAPADGMRVLEQVLLEQPVRIAPLPIQWPRFLAGLGPAGRRPVFARLRAQDAGTDAGSATPPGSELLRELDAAAPARRRERLQDHVERCVRRVLALDPSVAIGPTTGFTDLGMDSLMAVELSNHLAAAVGRKLPSTVALEHPTLPLLAEFLATEVLGLPAADATTPATPANRPAAGRGPETADLSDEELEDTLLKELERAGY